MDSKVISDYYENLPFGKKDEFVRVIAEALEQSTSNIRRKIRENIWSRIEMKEVTSLIDNYNISL